MHSFPAPESTDRTTAFLLDARNHLSQVAEGVCADEIFEFEERLERRELELALDTLDDVVAKSGFEGLRVVELMALAAASMGLADRVTRYDEYLSKIRGIPYVTRL